MIKPPRICLFLFFSITAVIPLVHTSMACSQIACPETERQRFRRARYVFVGRFIDQVEPGVFRVRIGEMLKGRPSMPTIDVSRRINDSCGTSFWIDSDQIFFVD